jgi:hypothetical protein
MPDNYDNQSREQLIGLLRKRDLVIEGDNFLAPRAELLLGMPSPIVFEEVKIGV